MHFLFFIHISEEKIPPTIKERFHAFKYGFQSKEEGRSTYLLGCFLKQKDEKGVEKNIFQVIPFTFMQKLSLCLLIHNLSLVMTQYGPPAFPVVRSLVISQ